MLLTPTQIQKLQSLGISSTDNPRVVPNQPTKSPIFPLLSISGITLISFGSLVLLKSKATSYQLPITNYQLPISPTPTQVPKSIQHYLLASQQAFSQALQLQNNQSDPSQIVDLLNQSILSATSAITDFPQDHRGYLQRGQIYQALADSQPQYLKTAINDLVKAFQLNPNSAEITRLLASLYAKTGDAESTLNYLTQTVTLEPTKAQNFYDLARIQQQAGLIPEALNTYNQLLPLITDPSQIATIKSETLALENLINQSPNVGARRDAPSPTKSPDLNLDSQYLEAQLLTNSGLIIAAPEQDKNLQVKNLTDSNAFSGAATLLSGQKEITIKNSSLTPTSQVYLTITKGGKNQTLQLISKSDSSFTVGLSSPISENIEFKWWIIN
ncbi:hypothetical protein KJ909_00270 [Patescibacteria group bacterium]|nr:hypothetical protein [Patescibacteria group bacterium]